LAVDLKFKELWFSYRQGKQIYSSFQSLRKGNSPLEHNSLISTIPWLTPTRTLSPSHTRPWPPYGSLPSTTCFCTWTRPYPVTLLPIGSGYSRAKPFPIQIPQHLSNLVILHIYLPRKVEQTVPKCRHIKFRRWGITQKKAHNKTDLSLIQHIQHGPGTHPNFYSVDTRGFFSRGRTDHFAI
jgi:hypothetical protein